VPPEAYWWDGFGSVEVLLAPEPGSPKSHCHPTTFAPDGELDASLKVAVPETGSTEEPKSATGGAGTGLDRRPEYVPASRPSEPGQGVRFTRLELT
jgi:hypothetical protein